MTSQKGIIYDIYSKCYWFPEEEKNLLLFLKHSNTNSVINQQTLYHFKQT